MEETLSNQERARIEMEQLDLYREVYLKTNPFPKEPEYEEYNRNNYSFVQVVGIPSVGFTLAAVGGIVYSAIRTAGVFVQKEVEQFEGYGLDAKLVQIIAVVASFTIMLTVEGFLAAVGYHKGKESGRLDINWYGPAIAFSISALAGFLPSFSLLPVNTLSTFLQDSVSYLLFILSGFGIAALVLFGSHNVGVIGTKWEEYLKGEKEGIDARNKTKKDAYDADVDAWNDTFEAEYRTLGRAALFDAGEFKIRKTYAKRTTPAPTPAPSGSNGAGMSDRLRTAINKAGLVPSEIGDGLRASPAQIADICEPPLTPEERKQLHAVLNRFRTQEREGKWQTVNV